MTGVQTCALPISVEKYLNKPTFDAKVVDTFEKLLDTRAKNLEDQLSKTE